MEAPESTDFRDTAVVMITKNEEAAIAKVVDDALTALPGVEVVVVDGSSDRTPEIATEHGARVIKEPAGGPAPALLCALKSTARPIVVTVDADDTYPASIYPTLVDAIRRGYDIVGTDRIGTRPPPSMPFPNWCANVLFNLIASARVGRRLKDVHSGQRAYRRDLIDGFDWDVTGLAFPVDLLLWPAFARRKIVEIPIAYRERVGETTLNRWPSGKATLQRLLRPLRGRVPRDVVHAETR
jgi:glycosyltransferase involved in cell wall biosynthesis